MAAITPTECGKKIRSGEYDNLYLFYGRDVGALDPFAKKLAAKLCPKEAQVMNLHSFDADTLNCEQLDDAVQVLPMFAERVVVTLGGLNMDKLAQSKADALRSVLKNIPETTVVIINMGGDDRYRSKKALTDKNRRFADLCAKLGTVCEFSYKTAGEVSKSIIAALGKRGAAISPQDARYLAELCLCETVYINMEVDKLAAYANGGSITRADIDALCIKRVESDGFGLALNILRGNAVYVFHRLGELKQQGYEPTSLLAMINMSLSDIYRASLARTTGIDYRQCAEDFGYPRNREFAVKNAFGECGSISSERLHTAIKLLSDTELRMKTRSMNPAAQFLAIEQYAAAVMA